MKKNLLHILALLFIVFLSSNCNNSNSEENNKENNSDSADNNKENVSIIKTIDSTVLKINNFIENGVKTNSDNYRRLDEGKDEYGEPICTFYYYDKVNNLIKITTYPGFSFYISENKLILIDICQEEVSEQHYYNERKWLFCSNNETNKNYNTVTYNNEEGKKDIIEMFDRLIKSEPKTSIHQMQAKYVFGELHQEHGYTLEFNDIETNKSFVFRFPTYDEFKKFNIELVDFETQSASDIYLNKIFQLSYTTEEGVNEFTGDKETKYILKNIAPVK